MPNHFTFTFVFTAKGAMYHVAIAIAIATCEDVKVISRKRGGT